MHLSEGVTPGAEGPAASWSQVSMEAVLEMAENNVREGCESYPEVHDVLQDLHRILLKVAECVEHDGRSERIVPRMLMVRVHATLLASARLAWGGQVDQAYPLLRVAIEQAWYALHMAADPEGEARAVVSLRRNDDPEAQRRCKREFTVARVRETHETLDASAAAIMQRLYERMIDFGAHPNQLGALSVIERSWGDEDTFGMPLLTDKPLPRLLALRMTANVGLGALHVFRHIYPERWKITGLDLESDRFHERMERVFGAFAERFKAEAGGRLPLE